MGEKCTGCGKEIGRRYLPMTEWGIDGPLCGKCYSNRLAEFYPGDHVRMGSQAAGGGGSGSEGAEKGYIQIDKTGSGRAGQ